MNLKKMTVLIVASLALSGLLQAQEKEITRVKFVTTMGDITLELYPDKAPETVDNFLRYVDEGFYKGTIFHRVIPNFMIQGGGFDSKMSKKPTHDPIRNEAANELKNDRGTVAMARTSIPDSATAQFFINAVDNKALNFKDPSERGIGYCVFGRVVDGIDILDAIQSAPTGTRAGFRDVPLEEITIKDAVRIKPEAVVTPTDAIVPQSL